MCKSSSSKVRHVAEASSSSCAKASDSSGEDPLNIFAAAASSLETQKDVAINGYDVSIIVDTGADLNILPSNLGVPLTLSQSSSRVRAWGQFEVPVLGKASCVVSYRGKSVTAEFTVVQLRDNVSTMPLFSLT